MHSSSWNLDIYVCVRVCVCVHCGPALCSWKASEQERGLKGKGYTTADDDRFLEASLSLKTREKNRQQRFMGVLFPPLYPVSCYGHKKKRRSEKRHWCLGSTFNTTSMQEDT